MPKPTSYQLLKDTHASINRLEDKMDRRMVSVENRMDDVESKTDNLLGKIGIGIMVMSAVVSGAISLVVNFFKDL